MKIAPSLLSWYDAHARELPWRVGPAARAAGEVPDPYRVWLSEIMLQQTTVPAVGKYFAEFTRRWPSVQDLAAAPDAEVMAAWAGLGYYARARNLLKCARYVAKAGAFPTDEAGLLELPGVGPYTAAAVAAIAFDRPATVVDANVERVVSRLFAITDPLPASKPQIKASAATLTPQKRPGDFAQAMMDLGATICTTRRPACLTCPISQGCQARIEGIAPDLPKKAPKVAKPVRKGHVFVAISRKGDVLLETRPDSGLLGGMLGFPGSDWSDAPTYDPPFKAQWEEVGTVRHTFTHFHLILGVHRCRVADATEAYTPGEAFEPDALPTLMRKVWRLAGEAAHA